ncbi:MAG: DUF2304 domain-containing protein [Planctomycetota bacterium]
MSTPGQLASVTSSLIVILLVIELVRRRKLSERFSLIWLFVAGGMVVASTLGFGSLINVIAPMMGIRYPPSALVFLAILGLVALCLYFSVLISRLNEQNRILAQRMALMELQVARRDDRNREEEQPGRDLQQPLSSQDRPGS